MNEIFTRFGISRRLVGADLAAAGLDYDCLGRSDDAASDPKTVRAAAELITPTECGLPLVRVGSQRDGGYLVPDDLDGIEACFSPGIGNCKDFEDHLAKRHGIRSYLCDHSSDVEQLRTPLIESMQFFEKKWLDVEPSPINLDINDWVRANSTPGRDLLLQMDIEGAEYRNLLHASPETLARFRIIVLEIHTLSLLAKSQFADGIFMPVMGKLARQFSCVHLHPNNCCGETRFGDDIVVPNTLEVTFLRKDRMQPRSIGLQLPHPQDAANLPAKAPLQVQGFLRRHADPQLSDLNATRETVDWLQKRVAKLTQDAAHAKLSAELAAFVATKTLGPHNVARGKHAIQSSLSPHSTHEGARGAVNGVKTGRFGFHTAIEDQPWWQVDLGEPHALDGVLLYNRIDNCTDRVRGLIVSISVDGKAWSQVHDQRGKPVFGGIRPVRGVPPLLVRLPGSAARYVKIGCAERTALHLDEVEVYGVPLAAGAAPASVAVSPAPPAPPSVRAVVRSWKWTTEAVVPAINVAAFSAASWSETLSTIGVP